MKERPSLKVRVLLWKFLYLKIVSDIFNPNKYWTKMGFCDKVYFLKIKKYLKRDFSLYLGTSYTFVSVGNGKNKL